MDNASPFNTSAGGDGPYAPGEGLKLGSHPRTVLLVWFSSLILAQAGLLLLLLTFSLSKSITPREPALVNLTVISFLGTFIYLILFYNGSWMDHLPPFAPCLIQTVLKHSFDIGYLVAVLILIFETWRSLRRLNNESADRVRGIRLYLIVTIPYLSAICVGLPVVFRATRHPTDIVRDDWSFYCTLNNPDIGKVIQGAQIVLVAIALIFQGLIIRLIFNYRAQHQLLSTKMMDVSRALRVSMFIALEVVLILFSSGLFEKWPVLRAGVLALAPALMFIVFGSQTVPLKDYTFELDANKVPLT
ncbi:hypothetical protein SISNIDRAFT_489197 [Sistotremastrum niveocremeum HHB9708]|uniref:G-protein coupled receptors family 3 profile domain-containing protein n=1 Tax=Sistotremastrum niveocremeum HHB9708 TaxID=1314777 RepID=A0A164QBL9_9AGAM|nr:hypothetical protein SISNIDRAFT_489197 [Sistotremastrum niveocremeum HHB9708]